MVKKEIIKNYNKYETRYEDNACTQIWKWDKSKNKNGPVSVETIWKTWILDEWENKRELEKDKD
jgi:hypothetical protein